MEEKELGRCLLGSRRAFWQGRCAPLRRHEVGRAGCGLVLLLARAGAEVVGVSHRTPSGGRREQWTLFFVCVCVALAPSALGVDGAALVCLWVKALRARAATRLQAAGRGLLARRLRLRLYRQSRPYLNTFYGLASLRTWVEAHVLAFE